MPESPARHIDAVEKLVADLFGEIEKDIYCWKCKSTLVPPKVKSGLCKVCIRNLKDKDED